MPKFVLRYLLDKVRYLGLEIYLIPILFSQLKRLMEKIELNSFCIVMCLCNNEMMSGSIVLAFCWLLWIFVKLKLLVDSKYLSNMKKIRLFDLASLLMMQNPMKVLSYLDSFWWYGPADFPVCNCNCVVATFPPIPLKVCSPKKPYFNQNTSQLISHQLTKQCTQSIWKGATLRSPLNMISLTNLL